MNTINKNRDLRYLRYDLNGKTLFIVKDHPVAIRCLRKAFDEGKISLDSLMIHIDKHTDSFFDEENIYKSKKIRKMSEDELDEFISGDLRFDNSEFIINLMFSGLIKDCISVHHERNNSYGEYIKGGRFTTDRYFFEEDGKEHNFYLWDLHDDKSNLNKGPRNISNLLSTQSILQNTATHKDTTKAYRESYSVILDIDLDFFTYPNEDVFALNKKDIKRQLTSYSFNGIVEKARVIIIAIEPGHCGSEKDALEILEAFNEYFFSNYGLDILEEIMTYFSLKMETGEV